MKAPRILLAVACAALTLVPATAAAQRVPGELIVTFKNGVSAQQAASFARVHHVRGTYLSTVNVLVVHVPEAQATVAMAQMQADPKVASVERSLVFHI